MLASIHNIAEMTRDLGRLLEDAETLADAIAACPVPRDVKTLAPELRAVIDLKEKAAVIEKSLGARRDLIERELVAFHEATGAEQFRGGGVSISFSDALRPRVDPERWPEVWAWAVEKKQSHILYRQLCSAKVLELMEGDNAPGLPPGVTVESYVKVNVRRV